MHEGILNQAKSATIACIFRGDGFSHSLGGLLNGSIVTHPALVDRCTFKSANPRFQTNVAPSFGCAWSATSWMFVGNKYLYLDT